MAAADLLTLNGQSQGILFILAIGAATDYSLLIVARFREELRDHESKYAAMKVAYKGAFEPIWRRGRPSSWACCACCSPTSRR